MHLNAKKIEFIFTRHVLNISILAMFVAVGMFSYLGVFSRYMSDDYCEAVSVRKPSSPFDAVIDRYLTGAFRAANRYSNLLFVGFSEMLGKNSIQVTTVAMVAFWGLGLIWCAHEIRKCLKIIWPVSVDFFLAISLCFHSLLLAPNLFQSVFWRSSMMTHFAPLVFGSFLSAYIVRQWRRLQVEEPSWQGYMLVFLGAFIIAGFSEPPTTTMITALLLLAGATWLWGKPAVKQKYLGLLAWTFGGAFLGFLVLVFSPASMNIVESRHTNVAALFGMSFYFSYLFIVGSLKSIPIPSFTSMLLPFLFIWLYQQTDSTPLLRRQKSALWMGVIFIPVLVWILIAAGFAPSVYGQGYPVERMLFLARTLMIISLTAEGILFGRLLKDLRFKPNHTAGQWAVLCLFAVLAVVYPMRAALNVYRYTIPEYRAHAKQWDLRDAYIREAVAAGAKDIEVVQLDSFGGAMEYKGDPGRWVNVCAARFYGLNTIVAP